MTGPIELHHHRSLSDKQAAPTSPDKLDASEGAGERLRARLRTWLVGTFWKIDPPPREYLDERVDEILEIFGYGPNGSLKAARVERGSRAVAKAVDEGMAKVLGAEPGGWRWEDYSDRVKIVYRTAALECVKAVRDA